MRYQQESLLAMEKQAEGMRVLIVDDHPVVRFGLQLMLKSESNISATGIAASAKEAWAEIQRASYDVVLIDMRMPEIEGAEAIAELRRIQPDIKILVLSNYEEDEYILRALRAGAMGYLLKSAPQAQIVQALATVHGNHHFFPPNITDRLMDTIGRQELSQRELEVLTLVAKGLTNKEVAQILVISDKTARNHVASCLLKLDANDRTEAVTTAIRRGLIHLSE